MIPKSSTPTPDTTVAISVQNVSKSYRIWRDPSARLKAPIWDAIGKLVPEFALNLNSKIKLRTENPERYYKDFYALKDVSFDVKKGEAVGIIGRNGSGKSTLLQMIAGTLTPTSGSIKVNGRVAALLELGSGFNPDFTGRENVYLNASILGLTREEIDQRIDAILAFADIGDFIEQPVKTYSSGMNMRLAFSVVAHVEPETLIIDEAFAVGDVFFQQKCMRFLRAFRQNKGTLLFVSHDMAAVVNLCSTAILLGRVEGRQFVKTGIPEEIAKIYIGEIYATRKSQIPAGVKSTDSDASTKSPESTHLIGEPMERMHYNFSEFKRNAESFGERGGTIDNAYFADEDNVPIKESNCGNRVKLIIEAKTGKEILYPAFGFMLKDKTGQFLLAESTDMPFRAKRLVIPKSASVKCSFTFDMPVLIRGEYTLNLAFAEGPGDEHIQHHWLHDAIVITVTGDRLVHGIAGLHDMTTALEINGI